LVIAMTRRRWLAAAALAPIAARAGADFPRRPIRLIVPWPVGGGTDHTMRVLAESAAELLGVPVQVDNRPGAAGTLAMPLLQQAAPDGHTIAQLPYTVFRVAHTQPVLWDPVRDVTPILQVSGVTFGVLVPAASPFRDLDALFEHARREGSQALAIATNGVGSTAHVVMQTLFARRGLGFVHVPYKGTVEQMNAVAGGQVAAGVNSTGFVPFVASGQLRLLCTFGERRSKRFPDTPTLRELGHGIAATSPYGIVGPRGLPRDVVLRLHDALRRAMFDSAHLAALDRFDQEPAYLDPAAYGDAIREADRQERSSVGQPATAGA
jgi:tripartite-type tricarboxylate transporter receptor subunit TctC